MAFPYEKTQDPVRPVSATEEEKKTLENVKTGLEARIQAENAAVTAAEMQPSDEKNTVIGEREIVFGALAVERSDLYGEKDPAGPRREDRKRSAFGGRGSQAGGAIERKTDANTQPSDRCQSDQRPQ